MIELSKLKLFPFRTNQISFLPSEKYNLIFYPENADFGSTYSKLNIKKMFARKATVLPNKIPKVIFDASITKSIRGAGLIPVRYADEEPGNVYVDTGIFLDKLDDQFSKGSYRRPNISGRIKSYLNNCFNIGQDRKDVLMYYIDLNSKFPKEVYNRRIWPLIEWYKIHGRLPCDYFMICAYSEGMVRYTLMSNPSDTISFSRFYTLNRSVLPIIPEEIAPQEDEKIDTASNKVSLDSDVATDDEQKKIKQAVSDYLADSHPSLKDKINSKELTEDDVDNIVLRSILYSSSGDMEKTDRAIKLINPENKKRVVDSVKKDLLPEIVTKDDYKNKSRDSVYGNIDIHGAVNNKEPSRVLNKRKVDFKTSFEKDLVNTFKILEKKSDFPLTLKKVHKESVPNDPGELEPSKEIKYTFTLSDSKNREHNIEIKVPEIQPDGTFLINGTKKFLIYQIILEPIFFLKEGIGKLETLYAPVSIHHRHTKYKSFYNMMIAGYSIPAFLVLGYQLGLEGICKLYRIPYTIQNEKPETGLYYFTSDNKYIAFKTESETWKRMIKSLEESEYPFKSKITTNDFQEAIIKHIGNRSCMYKIDNVLENIMEPISVQILKSKLLPIAFEDCMRYICEELTKGRVDRRNDLSKQRIRSSEVFTFQIQKLIISAYNDYRQRKVYGDKDAEFFVDARKIVSDIINSQLVRSLENINPLEELSSLTRITPVGAGGIPDKMALNNKAKSIDDSYYGNIDPMDTPEGDMIGIINQLTVDAAVGNARGSFKDKSYIEDDKAGMLSPMAAMLPYVNSCDGARVMLYCSQTKQAIPIANAEPPLVQTGYETIMTSMLTDSFIKKSPVDGIVQKVTNNVIVVKSSNGRVHRISLESEKLNSGQGQNSLNQFTSNVKIGQRVRSGEIMAEGKHIIDGVISTGTNLLVGIMGWKGYEFEDGYIISDWVAKNKLRSISYDEIVVWINKEDRVTFMNNEGKLTLKGEPLLMRVSKDIETLVNLEEGELQEGQIIKKSPGGKIIAIEIYPNININKFPLMMNQYTNFRSRYEEVHGEFPNKFTIKEGGQNAQFAGIKVVFKIEREEVSIVGDKVANNHGGKGVITLIEKRENMPITPWGESLDIILNPIAIINRMNPSTIFEMYSGLIAKMMAYQVVKFGPKKTKAAIDFISKVYTSLDNTKDRRLSTQIIKSFMSLNDAQYAAYIQKIIDRNYIMPVFAPPFQAPNKQQLLEAINIVGAKPSYTLRLPEIGKNTLNKIACGYLYYKKNEQQTALKMSARSVGRYRSKTLQPTAGKKAGGGQRLGEMDSWGMASHGAINVMRELMGPLSDDHATKNKMVSEIVQNGSVGYLEPTRSPTKDLLEVYMHALMLDAKFGEDK